MVDECDPAQRGRSVCERAKAVSGAREAPRLVMVVVRETLVVSASEGRAEPSWFVLFVGMIQGKGIANAGWRSRQDPGPLFSTM